MRSLQGERAYWDEQAEATASVVDAVERLAYYYAVVHSDSSPTAPATYQRPGQTVAPVETVSLAQFSQLLRE